MSETPKIIEDFLKGNNDAGGTIASLEAEAKRLSDEIDARTKINKKVTDTYIKEINTLKFCFDELLGELGWCDEIEETGVDPLDFARDEIKSLQRHARRVNRPLVSQDALYLASVWDMLVENGYLTEEFINNHVGVVSAATLASKTLAQMAASEA